MLKSIRFIIIFFKNNKDYILAKSIENCFMQQDIDYGKNEFSFLYNIFYYFFEIISNKIINDKIIEANTVPQEIYRNINKDNIKNILNLGEALQKVNELNQATQDIEKNISQYKENKENEFSDIDDIIEKIIAAFEAQNNIIPPSNNITNQKITAEGEIRFSIN
jgi:hypothetical protein